MALATGSAGAGWPAEEPAARAVPLTDQSGNENSIMSSVLDRSGTDDELIHRAADESSGDRGQDVHGEPTGVGKSG